MDETPKMDGNTPAGRPSRASAPFRGLGFDFPRLDQACPDVAPGVASGPDRATPRPAAAGTRD